VDTGRGSRGAELPLEKPASVPRTLPQPGLQVVEQRADAVDHQHCLRVVQSDLVGVRAARLVRSGLRASTMVLVVLKILSMSP